MPEHNGLDAPSLANVYTNQKTLPGHAGLINVLAWSPDGQHLASSSLDQTIRLWDGKTGTLLQTLTGFQVPIWSVVWSPDGQRLASSSLDGTIHLWDRKNGALLHIFRDHTALVWSLAWSSDGQYLASGSLDKTICIWDAQTGSLLYTLSGHTEPVMTVAWSPDGQYLASGSLDQTVCAWNAQTGELQKQFFSRGQVKSLLWSLHKHMFSSISLKNIIESWDLEAGEEGDANAVNQVSNAFCWSRNGQMVALDDASSHVIALLSLEKSSIEILEGLTGLAKILSFSSNDQFLASFALSESHPSQGVIHVWRKNISIWVLESTIRNIPTEACIAFHPDMEAIAVTDEATHSITILMRDEVAYSIDNMLADAVHYKNAKVVLVGDTGVGKTGLAFALIGKPYEATDSTHGRHIWTLHEDKLYRDAQCVEIREILLWDLAGQPGYRLIHQLYLDTITIALVVYDARSEIEPFTGVVYWERALRQARSMQRTSSSPTASLKKFLVEARSDRGGVGVSTGRLDNLMNKYGFDTHFKTSAKENIQVDALRAAIKEAIAWEELPGVSSTRLFQTIKSFLVEQKEAGLLLDTIDALYLAFLRAKSTLSKKEELYSHFESCIDRLESAGLIKRLSFGNLILLQPEILDAYASALINAVREEPEGFGSITEERVHKGDFQMSKNERLANKEQEKLLLIALIEDLLRRELVLREEPFLVFPSQSTHKYPDLPEAGQKTIVFTFEGPVLNIYVTLAVRLANSGMFKRNGLWKNAVTYTASMGGECGLLLNMDDEGRGELSLFFDGAANEQTRLSFEQYIHNHLERKLPETLKRKRIFVCDACSTVFTEKMIQSRIARGFDWLNCPVCETRISLLDKERRIGMSSSLIQIMDGTADRLRDQEAIKSSLEGKRASNSFDVFLWCSDDDKSTIKKYGRQLIGQGILPWFEDWEVQPGLHKQSEIEKYLKQAKSAAVFFGEGGVKAWVRLLEKAFVREFVENERPLIPVILPEATEMTLPDLPSTFQVMQWIDFRQQDPDPFNLLIWGITGKRPNL